MRHTQEIRKDIFSEEAQKKYKRLLEDPEYANAPDDDPKNPWQSCQGALSRTMTRFNAVGLQLYSLVLYGIISQPSHLTPEMRLIMQKFIEQSIGDNALNALLGEAINLNLSYQSYLIRSITKIRYLTYKTRGYDEFKSIIPKVKFLSVGQIFDSELSNDKKLTLKEFATIQDFSKIYKDLVLLKSLGMMQDNRDLEQLYDSAKVAHEFVLPLQKQAKMDLYELKGGIIMLDNTTKKSTILRQILDFFDKLVFLFCKYEHASMLYIKDEDDIKRSHINPILGQDDMGLQNYLYTDLYKIDVIKLIPEDKHIILKTIYGEDWKAQVLSKFQLIDNNIHSQINCTYNIEATSYKKAGLAGLANIIPFGHKQFTQNNFKEIHEKLMQNHYSNKESTQMLCSEFCAHIIIAGLVELNGSILEDVKKHKSSKQLGIDEIKDFVQIPFDRHENLERMHPERLLQQLEKYGCVEKLSIEKVDRTIKSQHTNKILQQKKQAKLPAIVKQ